MGAAGSAAQEQRSTQGMAACIAVATLSAFAAFGQELPAPSADPSSSPSSDAPPVLRLLPANTEIHLRMLESVGSATHRRGDRFKLEVADVVALDGQVIIPAGTPAQGEVIHAASTSRRSPAGALAGIGIPNACGVIDWPVRGCFVSGFRARSRTNFTSSAPSSRPLWKRTPFFRKKV